MIAFLLSLALLGRIERQLPGKGLVPSPSQAERRRGLDQTIEKLRQLQQTNEALRREWERIRNSPVNPAVDRLRRQRVIDSQKELHERLKKLNEAILEEQKLRKKAPR